MNTLPQTEAVKIVRAVVEGLSIRAAARLYNHHHNTVGRLLLRVGEGCAVLHDKLVRGVPATRVQVDEV
jgi:transposase